MEGMTKLMTELQEIGSTLEAVKGKEYMEIMITQFSMVNMVEGLLYAADIPTQDKYECGMIFATLSSQLLRATSRVLFQQKYPQGTEEQFTRYFEEVAKDIEMLRKKQTECI